MSVQRRPDGGDFREQDGQILQVDNKGNDPHPEWRWRERIQSTEWTVRAAWRDGDLIDWPGDSYARYHEPTGTILVAEWGVIQTVIHVDDAERDATLSAVREHKEGMVDDA